MASPPTPRRIRADAQANRQLIVAAATELFAAHGLSTSLDDIARRAGVGSGTVHRHFPSKDGLILAVALERLESMVTAAQRRAQARDPRGALHDQIQEMVIAGDASAPMKRALSDTASDVAWSETDVSRRLRDALGVLLAHAQQARDVRQDLTADDLMSLLAGCYAAIQRAGVPADSVVGHRLTNVLLAGVTNSQ